MKQRALHFGIALDLLAMLLYAPSALTAAELRIPDDLGSPETELPVPDSSAPAISEPDSPAPAISAPAISEPALEEELAPEEPTPEEEPAEPRPYAPLRITTACPEDVEGLSELLIRDLPGYTNRVLQRTTAVLPWTEADEQRAAAGEFVRSPYRPSHVLIAGKTNLEPLDLNEYAFTTDPAAGGPLTQVFFTTLSRQYSGRRFEQVQEYHWLFLTQTTAGWRMAFMFSEVDDANDIRGPLPPRENSLGTVGQAVRFWLRDCRAGAIEAWDIEEPAGESTGEPAEEMILP